jgi:hypothetical protein
MALTAGTILVLAIVATAVGRERRGVKFGATDSGERT